MIIQLGSTGAASPPPSITCTVAENVGGLLLGGSLPLLIVPALIPFRTHTPPLKKTSRCERRSATSQSREARRNLDPPPACEFFSARSRMHDHHRRASSIMRACCPRLVVS